MPNFVRRGPHFSLLVRHTSPPTHPIWTNYMLFSHAKPRYWVLVVSVGFQPSQLHTEQPT